MGRFTWWLAGVPITCGVCRLAAADEVGAAGKARGPLRVLPTNPRYFTDGSGKAVYLAGPEQLRRIRGIAAAR